MTFQIYGIIFFLIAFLISPCIPKLKGYLGERAVAKQFERLELEVYKILNNIMLTTSRGTSQIDHVILSPYGIFVVETKNYKGWIFGSENADTWTQVIYNKKTHFRNPIKQNWGHIYALKEALKEFKKINYIPIIIFAGSADLKKVDAKTDVIYPSELYVTILNHRGLEQLSPTDIENIYKHLSSISINDRKSRKKHNRNIRSRVQNNYNTSKAGICPKCKSNLVKRSGKYGDFIGCSNYPKCKYTHT